MATYFTDCEIQNLAIGPLCLDGRNNKKATIISDGPISFKFPKMRCPFGASLWQEAEGSRKNLSLEIPEDVQIWAAAIDEFILSTVSQRSEEFVGSKLDSETVKVFYTPLLKNSKSGYLPTIRTKVNLQGTRAIICFDEELRPRVPPDDFRCECQPVIKLSHIWIQNKSFGLILEVTHAIICDDLDVNPFV
jgi:hypothetical protein